MKKIAFVVQRYGLDVNGGAELHCRQLAEKLTDSYQVEVITTKAVDYVTWDNVYSCDQEEINGVTVRRFAVSFPRDIQKFNQFSQKVLQASSDRQEEEEWMRQQGPYSEGLLEYLERHATDYAVVIFFTYLYCTTYFGLPLAQDRAILIPTAHDELPIYLSIFKDMFLLPKGIFYNTELEKRFVEGRFHNEHILNNQGRGGVGVDLPVDVAAERFREKYGLQEDYILYIGRIEEHKGCGALFQYFKEYKKRNKKALKLVLMGKEVMEIPKMSDIISLGFVEDQDKFDGLAGCRFLVLPSQFESLSMVVLEAMALKKAVLVHANCEVVKEHCIISNGGLYYQNYFEFEGCINYLLGHEAECGLMGENGKKYVDKFYAWDAIIGRLSCMIEQVADMGGN